MAIHGYHASIPNFRIRVLKGVNLEFFLKHQMREPPVSQAAMCGGNNGVEVAEMSGRAIGLYTTIPFKCSSKVE